MKKYSESIKKKLQNFLKKEKQKEENLPPYLENCYYPLGWGARERGFFNRESKAYIFKSIMSFFSTHEVPGDYFEFGCFGAYTMRMAWDYTKVLCSNMHYYAFDSFQGFPKVKGIDYGHWKEGDLAMSETDFRKTCTAHGLPNQKLSTIKGFFSDSLNSKETIQKLEGKKAAIIYIDVDTYSPASEVLEFISPYLQRGTIIVFDDWNCFYADDDFGERRAWKEFKENHKELVFTPYVSTHLAQTFICLNTNHDFQ